MNTNRKLVAYFSCSGVTERAAKALAGAAHADLYEIAPRVRYTAKDLDWRDANSRSSVEMNDPSARPELGGAPIDMSAYDVIFVGFPIWWYVAPKIVNTFLERHDLAGKTVVPFATSGGSGLGDTVAKLKPSAPDALWKDGKMLNGGQAFDTLAAWVDGLGV